MKNDNFPVKDIADRVWQRYYRDGGRKPSEPYINVPMIGINPSMQTLELVILANFAEVFLAKEGHDGLVGINYLEKIQLPHLPSIYGAMLAGVDYILMGAGIPKANQQSIAKAKSQPAENCRYCDQRAQPT